MDELDDIQLAIANSSEPAEEFCRRSPERRRDLFFRFPQPLQESVIADMDAEQLQSFVRWLDPDEVTDVLALAAEERRDAVLRQLDETRRERVEYLLGFEAESAAGLMRLNYITVDITRGLETVAERVRKHEDQTGEVPTILVTDNGELVGQLPGQVLAMTDEHTVDFAEHIREIPSVPYNAPDTTVADVFRDNSKSSVVVLDEDGAIIGVIYRRFEASASGLDPEGEADSS